MADIRCPGQDQRYWKAEDIYDINCPDCGCSIEFFKDEPFRICPKCKTNVRNSKIDLGCAKWCKYASQCLGSVTDFQGNNISSICEKLKSEMRLIFGKDEKRINHALKVLEYAENIIADEHEADQLVVRAAAILHDIGIHEAEKKYNSTAGNYQEIEGVPIAGKILRLMKIDNRVTEHVCKIIGSHHSANNIDSIEFRVVWDADWLVNWNDIYQDLSNSQTQTKIDNIFKTAGGKKIAQRLFMRKPE